MTPTQTSILDAISAELEDTPTHLDFRIKSRRKEGAVWVVQVDLDSRDAKGLDESLEGAGAWWPGPPKGAADVLSVIPENEQINLRFASREPPGPGGMLRVYLPRYLEALRACWEDDEWAGRCLSWLGRSPSPAYAAEACPSPAPFGWLRRRQADAFRLPGWDVGFLWGPPGTGKTTTMGALLASHLCQFPRSKVLLLSTTNFAVDQALVAVDRQLASLGRRAEAARAKCFRIGNHFNAGLYEGREHLIPIKDQSLIRRLASLEARRPEPERVSEYARWKEEVEAVRAEMRRQAGRVLDDARLAAMTTTRAVFTFAELRDRSPYDLVVFDEASQVGLAHALAVAPVGRRALFAGDPRQLAPIVRSEHELAAEWLGRSMFARMDERAESTCLLDEQSRMAGPICELVSHIFYKGTLRVAADHQSDREWQRERTPPDVRPLGRAHLHVENVAEDGQWSHKYHGPIRYASASFIRDLLVRLCAHTDEKEVIVLSPFRAQRALIKQLLRHAGLKRVKVSTVHRAQGSEAHTVVFDPTQGDNPFMSTEDARRLVNVALSRAQARLVVMMSPGDRKNPLLQQIWNVVGNADKACEAADVSHYALRLDFPSCAVGQTLRIKSRVGVLTEVAEGGRSFTLLGLADGRPVKYITEHVVAAARREGGAGTTAAAVSSGARTSPPAAPPEAVAATSVRPARVVARAPRTGATVAKRVGGARLIKKVARATGASAEMIGRVINSAKTDAAVGGGPSAGRPRKAEPTSPAAGGQANRLPVGSRVRGMITGLGRGQASVDLGGGIIGMLEVSPAEARALYFRKPVEVVVLSLSDRPKLRLLGGGARK